MSFLILIIRYRPALCQGPFDDRFGQRELIRSEPFNGGNFVSGKSTGICSLPRPLTLWEFVARMLFAKYETCNPIENVLLEHSMVDHERGSFHSFSISFNLFSVTFITDLARVLPIRRDAVGVPNCFR